MAAPARLQLEANYCFEQVARDKRSALVIDFDITLSSLPTPPHNSFPLPTIRELLDCIVMTGRTRVIVTGRGAAHRIAQHFAPPFPEVWGCDGLERMNAVAADAAPANALCIRSRSHSGTFHDLLRKLSARGPLAYLVGDRISGSRLLVRPHFHLSPTLVVPGPAEELVQFLVNWLRASAAEIC